MINKPTKRAGDLIPDDIIKMGMEQLQVEAITPWKDGRIVIIAFGNSDVAIAVPRETRYFLVTS